jgi:hypothetical protein
MQSNFFDSLSRLLSYCHQHQWQGHCQGDDTPFTSDLDFEACIFPYVCLNFTITWACKLPFFSQCQYMPLVTTKIWFVINHEGVNGVKGVGGFDLAVLLGLLVVVKWFQFNWINYFNGCLAKRWDVLQCVKSTYCCQMRYTSIIIILGGRWLSCNFIRTTI